MFIACDFFAGDAMQNGIIVERIPAMVVSVVELWVLGLFEFQ